MPACSYVTHLLWPTDHHQPKGMNGMNEQDYKDKVLANIKETGWHCTAVGAGENTPEFSYTVGLFKTHGLPELIIIGLPFRVAHHLLGDIIDLLLKGELDFTVPALNIIKNYPVFFLEV